jgi:hypothetical protein
VVAAPGEGFRLAPELRGVAAGGGIAGLDLQAFFQPDPFAREILLGEALLSLRARRPGERKHNQCGAKKASHVITPSAACAGLRWRAFSSNPDQATRTRNRSTRLRPATGLLGFEGRPRRKNGCGSGRIRGP